MSAGSIDISRTLANSELLNLEGSAPKLLHHRDAEYMIRMCMLWTGVRTRTIRDYAYHSNSPLTSSRSRVVSRAVDDCEITKGIQNSRARSHANYRVVFLQHVLEIQDTKQTENLLVVIDCQALQSIDNPRCVASHVHTLIWSFSWPENAGLVLSNSKLDRYCT